VTATGYQFGAFRFDRVTYQVIRGSETVDLTPKLLDLLLYLLERPATLVTKEELLDALWPGANVTENALAQAVSELRQGLGDEASAPQFIRTVARRGYRFVAPVTPLRPPVPERQPVSAATSSLPLPAATERDARAVAVLDFVHTSADPGDAWLAAGIAETVTNDLRRLGHFRVVDRRRVVEAARATDGSLDAISSTLGVRLLVVGSVQRSQQRVRITSRIVDVVSGEALADAKVDGDIDGIFELQDEVVRQLAREMALPAGTHARDTASLRAFQAFTEGWVRLESLEVAQSRSAVVDFERAVFADPKYARAYTGLASAELACYESTRADNAPDQSMLERAIAHAREGIRLDDTLAEAHATLALVLVSSGQSNLAAAAGRRAVALEPSNWRHSFRLGHSTWGSERLRAGAQTLALYPEFAFAHFQAAMVHVARRNLAEAETVLRQGAAVQDRQIARGGRYPALGLHWLLGMVRLAHDDVDEALEEFGREAQFAELHRLYGREFQMHAATGRAAALMCAGRLDEAIESFRRALTLYPGNAPANLGLARALEARGLKAEQDTCWTHAEAALQILQRTRPVYAAIVKAEMLTARNDSAAAGKMLWDLLDTAPPGFACWSIPVEPAFRQVIDSPAFAPVLEALDRRAR
jgi:DNA-binding winged helix-turn-helix (wHTH) protein/cytochrome c-type biogenesis protein CcmH/NrfG